MIRIARASFVALLAALAMAQGSARAPAPPSAESELRGMTQELLDAIAPGETMLWERYLHERFLHLDEYGVVRDKAGLLAELQPLPAGLVGRIEIDRFRAEIVGDTAVTAWEMQEFLDYHGQPVRSRFRSADTWVRTEQGWRLLAQHTAAILKDPRAVTLPRADLCAYAGTYTLTPAIQTTLRCAGDTLVSERAGRPAVEYKAELRDVFFAPGQPRTRRIFTRDPKGAIDGFVDRREGEDIRWARTVGAGS